MAFVIIGNGPAGVVAAETLRKQVPEQEIFLVGDEDESPYSRMAIPYLLGGKIGEDGTYLRKSADHYASLRIAQREGRATALDPGNKTVLFQDA